MTENLHIKETDLQMKEHFPKSIGNYLDRRSKPFLLIWSVISVIVIGIADYMTGQEISFTIFYMIPVSLIAWFANRSSGILLCVISSAAEFVANYISGRAYSHPLIYLWNSGVLFGFFLISVFILSLLKTEFSKRIKVIGELRNLLAELTRTKEELERKSQELARSNVELEQFASVVSHDLKQPLLAITIALKLLRKKYRDKLDPGADEFITDAINESMMMQTLISDILSYSRAGSNNRQLILTGCSDILNRALSNLKITLQQSGATVTHENLPEVMADPVQLVQLFQNLIDNAIKYRGEDKPHIHISAERNEKEWVFSVKDNGTGIPLEYSKRIFEIFQRVPDRKASGSGIGLATCKRIVERRGGRIWVESEPERARSFILQYLTENSRFSGILTLR